MALAAALMLVPSAFSQTFNPEKYVNYPDQKVGLNKFLKNTEPNDDGEYTLRVETFTTGSVSKHAVPTDFVLVLDCSGSMHYDCLYGKDRPESLTEADNNDPDNDYYQFLRPAHTTANMWDNIHCYTYSYGYRSGNRGDTKSTGAEADGRTSSTPFNATTGANSNTVPSLYYYYDQDQTFYLIHREDDGSHYRIYITTSQGKKYLRANAAGNDIELINSTSNYDGTWNNSANKILLVGGFNKGDGHYDHLYRPLMRREPLEDGVKRFLDSILSHNQNDHFTPGVTKHRVSIIAFGSGYSSGYAGNSTDPSTTVNAAKGSGSRVVSDFAEITSSNVNNYKNALNNSFSYRGYTYIFLGMRLAKRLLQKNQSGDFAPTKRNKVVVVFTDGQPSPMYSDGRVAGSTTDANTNGFNNAKLALADAKIIKAAYGTGTGYNAGTDAKIFTIDLAGTASTTAFLEHLSSDYPDGLITNTAINMGDAVYSGTEIADPMFYMDANAGGLEEAFESIADASSGGTTEHMVAVDVINDSFDLPEGISTSGKIKLFTAQCIGTKEIDGETYLAFAEDVPVADRPELSEIWFASQDDDGNTVWSKQTNLDIDTDITYVIDGKKLIFKGFDFANLWCGLDEYWNDSHTPHNNTRQIESEDPNYSYQVDGYRGFKLIAEFPIVVAEDAVGGPDVPTNIFDLSGLFNANADGVPISETPIVKYPKPALTIPIKLVIQKTGLNQGESASFTIERKLASSTTATWTEFTTFVLTGNETATDIPEIRFISLDPRYHYRVKESGWSWAYENADPSFVPSTETGITNPIVFENDPQDGPKHAEAKAVNKMRKTASQTITVYDKTK